LNSKEINAFIAPSQTAKDVSTEVIQQMLAKPILVYHHPKSKRIASIQEQVILGF
jgi:hypothetical protein